MAFWSSRGGSVNGGESAADDVILQPAQNHLDPLFYLFLQSCQEPVFGSYGVMSSLHTPTQARHLKSPLLLIPQSV